MSPYSGHNEFTRAYTEGSLTNYYPLNAFKNAILNYIQIREGWGSGTEKKYGWRGALSSGRLFFNRQKTSNNIRVMREVVEIIDSDFSYQQKMLRIRQLRTILSSSGMGRKLIDIFLLTVVDEKSAYIPSGLRDDFEQSVYVSEGKKYESTKVLGRGVYGEVSRFQHAESGEKVVVKKFIMQGQLENKLLEKMNYFKKFMNTWGDHILEHQLNLE